MGKITRRDFNRALASGIVGAGAAGVSMALGGKTLAKEPGPNPDYMLSVLGFGYEGPLVSDYNNRPRAIREKLTKSLKDYGVPLKDPGAILAELEFRGIDFERFLQYPGIFAQLDPKSNLIKNTGAIVGMCTDYERVPSSLYSNYGRQQSPDTVSAKIVDMEQANIIATIEKEGFFERNMMNEMIERLAEDISIEYRRIRDGY